MVLQPAVQPRPRTNSRRLWKKTMHRKRQPKTVASVLGSTHTDEKIGRYGMLRHAARIPPTDPIFQCRSTLRRADPFHRGILASHLWGHSGSVASHQHQQATSVSCLCLNLSLHPSSLTLCFGLIWRCPFLLHGSGTAVLHCEWRFSLVLKPGHQKFTIAKMHSEHAGCLYVFCVSVCVCAYLCACLLVCVCVCAMFLAEGRHAVRIQQD